MNKSAYDSLPSRRRAPPTAERPKCRACHKPLRPYYRWVHADSDVRKMKDPVAKEWDGTYGYGNLFCNKTCACEWALVICKHLEDKGKGLVLKKKEEVGG